MTFKLGGHMTYPTLQIVQTINSTTAKLPDNAKNIYSYSYESFYSILI